MASDELVMFKLRRRHEMNLGVIQMRADLRRFQILAADCQERGPTGLRNVIENVMSRKQERLSGGGALRKRTKANTDITKAKNTLAPMVRFWARRSSSLGARIRLGPLFFRIQARSAGETSRYACHTLSLIHISAPTPESLARAMDALWADRRGAAAKGEAGRARYEGLKISWENVVEKLLC